MIEIQDRLKSKKSQHSKEEKKMMDLQNQLRSLQVELDGMADIDDIQVFIILKLVLTQLFFHLFSIFLSNENMLL